MLKILRMALTAAVIVAIALRLRYPTPKAPGAPGQGASGQGGSRLGGPGQGAVLRGVVAGGVSGSGGFAGSGSTPGGADRAASGRRRGRLFGGVLVGVGLVLLAAGVYAVGGAIAQAVERAASAAPPFTPMQLATPTAVGTPIVDVACTPLWRPAMVRPIDPLVTRRVNHHWRRIERWLKVKAPKSYASLRGPGKARTIAIAESNMGLDFPDDLRASLLRHNGASRFGFGYDSAGSFNHSIRQVRDSWRRLCAEDSTDEGPDPRGERWNGRMIPYAGFRAGSTGREDDFAMIDSARGDVGWHEGTHSPGFPRASSYLDLMRATADALEQGGDIAGWKPEVHNGTLTWDRNR